MNNIDIKFKNQKLKETFVLAYKNHKENNLMIAKKLYSKILQKEPNHPETLYLLGSLFFQIQKFNDAIETFYKVIKINPNHSLTYSNLGCAFIEIGEFQKAIQALNKAITIDAKNPDAYYNLGNIMKRFKEFEKAKNYYLQNIEIQPNNEKTYNNLGNVLIQLKNFPEAINSYKKAIQIMPNHKNAHFNLGNLYKQIGDFSKAQDSYEMAIESDPDNLEIVSNLSEFNAKILDSDLKNKVTKILKNNETTKKNIAYGNFLLSKYELREKNYEKEFDYLLKGHLSWFEAEKSFNEKGVNYWINILPKTQELIDLSLFIKNIKKINNKIKPIFIVGVPRCGSTLVEKVIASGPKKIPIGEEVGIINSIVGQTIVQGQSLAKNIENIYLKIIASYKQKGLIQEKSDCIFTDKTLDNFFFVSLIKEIFPDAKIINCKRNALSSIMSILKNNLGEVTWAHNLKHIFQYFDIYNQKIKEFKKIYPNSIYELNLEKFSSDPVNESKKLMQYCNLPWSNKCLEFYKRKDLVSMTSSNIQIRKAIYKDPAARYSSYGELLIKYGNEYSWFNFK